MDHPERRYHLPTIHFQVLCHAGFRKGIPMMGARLLRFVRLQHRKTIGYGIESLSHLNLYSTYRKKYIISFTQPLPPFLNNILVAAYWHLPKTLTKTWDATQTISEGRLLVGTFAMVLSVFASSSRYFPSRQMLSQIQGHPVTRSLLKQHDSSHLISMFQWLRCKCKG